MLRLLRALLPVSHAAPRAATDGNDARQAPFAGCWPVLPPPSIFICLHYSFWTVPGSAAAPTAHHHLPPPKLVAVAWTCSGYRRDAVASLQRTPPPHLHNTWRAHVRAVPGSTYGLQQHHCAALLQHLPPARHYLLEWRKCVCPPPRVADTRRFLQRTTFAHARKAAHRLLLQPGYMLAAGYPVETYFHRTSRHVPPSARTAKHSFTTIALRGCEHALPAHFTSLPYPVWTVCVGFLHGSRILRGRVS